MNINIRLDDTEENIGLINALKKTTETKSASRAFVSSSKQYLNLLDQLSISQDKLERAENKIYLLEKIIGDLDSSCRAALEITGQGNLL